MDRTRCVLCCVFLLAGPVVFQPAVQAQSNRPPAPSAVSPTAQPAQTLPIPIMDGGAGPCSLELTATTGAGSPANAATIKVHIAYGFGGFHRLDLEAGTNADGKVKFIGLPSRVHHPPLEFQASKDQSLGMATYDPDEECQTKHDIVLQKPRVQ